MLLIGTDDGIYRWAEGSDWPVFHGLQGRGVVGLASPGAELPSRHWIRPRLGEWQQRPELAQGCRCPTGSAGRRPSPWAAFVDPPGRERAGAVSADARLDAPHELAAGAGPPGRAEDRRAGHDDRPEPHRRRHGRGRAAEASGDRRPPRLDPARRPQARDPREVTTMTATLEAWYAAVAGEGLWASTDGGGRIRFGRKACRPTSAASTCRASRATSSRPRPTASGSAAMAARRGSRGARASRRPDVHAVESCPDQPDFLLAGAAPARPASGPAPISGLYESKDAGKSWVRVLRRLPREPAVTRSPTSASTRPCPRTRPSPSSRARCGSPSTAATTGSPSSRDIHAAQNCPVL